MREHEDFIINQTRAPPNRFSVAPKGVPCQIRFLIRAALSFQMLSEICLQKTKNFSFVGGVFEAVLCH